MYFALQFNIYGIFETYGFKIFGEDKIICRKRKKGQSFMKKTLESTKQQKQKAAKNPVERAKKKAKTSDDGRVFCIGCHMSWEEDQEIAAGDFWIQCNKCQNWLHAECCDTTIPDSDSEPYYCPDCN
jgi:hypothetical protein